MTVADLLERVRDAGGRVEAVGGGRLAVEAPAPLPADLLEALRARKQEVLRALSDGVPAPSRSTVPGEGRHPQALADGPLIWGGSLPAPWPELLRPCRDWIDLGRVVDDAQVLYADGRLDGEVVERVARVAGILSRRLPEVARGGHSEERLPPAAEHET